MDWSEFETVQSRQTKPILSLFARAVKLYRKAGFVFTGRAEKELKVGRRFYAMRFM